MMGDSKEEKMWIHYSIIFKLTKIVIFTCFINQKFGIKFVFLKERLICALFIKL